MPSSWLRRFGRLVAGGTCLLTLLLLGACAVAIPLTADTVTVSGTAAYLQRLAMPPEAVLTVRVEDGSRADVPATVLAEVREPFGTRQVPIAFSVSVARAMIDPRFSYAVRATITVGSELRFTTTRSYPVLTQGAPNRVELLLDAVATAELKDTYWKLVELSGSRITMTPTQSREVRITLSSKDMRLAGFSGCNSVAGTYMLGGAALRFSQLAGTSMACVLPLAELESQVIAMLGAVTAYRIDAQQLMLLDGDRVLARFDAVYLR